MFLKRMFTKRTIWSPNITEAEMLIGYRVRLAVCLPDHTWRPYTLDLELDDEGCDGHTQGEIAEAAEDQYRGEHPDVSAVGMIEFEREPEWATEWREVRDNGTHCPKCGQVGMGTAGHTTLCQHCGWHAHNPVAAREDTEDITWCPDCEPLPKDGVLRLGWEQWVRMFKPIKNFIDQNASVDGYMFETYGLEYEAVVQARSKDPHTIWTMIDEDGSRINEGWHFANRMGYFITEVPYDPHIQYIVDEEENEFDQLSEDDLQDILDEEEG
jgi:hypothetical protein